MKKTINTGEENIKGNKTCKKETKAACVLSHRTQTTKNNNKSDKRKNGEAQKERKIRQL